MKCCKCGSEKPDSDMAIMTHEDSSLCKDCCRVLRIAYIDLKRGVVVRFNKEEPTLLRSVGVTMQEIMG